MFVCFLGKGKNLYFCWIIKNVYKQSFQSSGNNVSNTTTVTAVGGLVDAEELEEEDDEVWLLLLAEEGLIVLPKFGL